jgi:hypothetical protein
MCRSMAGEWGQVRRAPGSWVMGRGVEDSAPAAPGAGSRNRPSGGLVVDQAFSMRFCLKNSDWIAMPRTVMAAMRKRILRGVEGR